MVAIIAIMPYSPPPMKHVPLVVVLFALCCVSAYSAEPAMSNKHYLGMNLWFPDDWSGNNEYVDIVQSAREWQDYAWTRDAVRDSNSWPNEDCSTVIFGKGCEAGDYHLVFNGSATVALLWTMGTVSNVQYDPVTNTTTATVTKTSQDDLTGGLKFSNTKKTPTSATNTGISNVRLYRPGYPTDGSKVFTDPFVALVGKFHALRFMAWMYIHQNPLVTWDQRRKPGQANAGDVTINGRTGYLGNVLEDAVLLCNTVNADLWINVPVCADNDYVTKLARLIRYGTDAAGNPYTATTTNPVHPPLNSGLKVYVEYGNEIWNTNYKFKCYGWVKQQSDAILGPPYDHPIDFDGESDPTTLMARYSAWKTVEISKIFRQVFGDSAMMSRVRPALMGQLGGNWLNPRELPWLEAFYSTARPAGDPFPNTSPVPVSYHIYCAGGSAYYGANDETNADPNVYLAPTNYPGTAFYNNTGLDALRAKNHGLKRVAYEGGLDLSGKFTDALRKTLNADPRIQDFMETFHDEWTATGGDLLMYFCTRGTSEVEFTPDTHVLNTPKLLAVDNIRDVSERVPVDFGVAVPGTLNARQWKDARLFDNNSWSIGDVTVNGEKAIGGVDPGEWLAFPVNCPADQLHNLTLFVAGAAGTRSFEIWVNGAVAGTVNAVTTGTNVLVESGPLPVTLQKGLNAVRVKVVSGASTILHSLKFVFQEALPEPIPGTVPLFSEGFAQGLPAPWTTVQTGGASNPFVEASASVLSVSNLHSQANTSGSTAYITRMHNVAAAGKPALAGYFDIDFDQLAFDHLNMSGQGTIDLFQHWLSNGAHPTNNLSLIYSGWTKSYSFQAYTGVQWYRGLGVSVNVSIPNLQQTHPRLRFYYDSLFTNNGGNWTVDTLWTVVNRDTGATIFTLHPTYTGTPSSSWNPLTDTAQSFRYGCLKHTTWSAGLLTGRLVWQQIYSGAAD